MSTENKAIIYTQHGVSYHSAANPMVDFVNKQIRSRTFNGSPHLGSGLIASQLKAQGYNIDYKAIEETDRENWTDVITKYQKGLFSAMDIQVDRVANIFQNQPDLQKISVVGGQGVTTSVAKNMSNRFPEASFVVGRAENILHQAMQKNGVHVGEPYNLKDFISHPAMNSEYTFRNDEWFIKSGMKLLELTTGCTQSCDYCPIPAGNGHV